MILFIVTQKFYVTDSVTMVCISLWVGIVIQYIYIYLKRNNFLHLAMVKNSIINFLIIFAIFLLLWSLIWIIVINKNQYLEGYPNYDHLIQFEAVRNIFFNFVLLTFIELLILSFFNNEKHISFSFTVVILIFLLHLTYVFYTIKPSIGGKSTLLNENTKLLIYINLLVLSFLIFINFLKRFINKKRNIKFYKKIYVS